MTDTSPTALIVETTAAEDYPVEFLGDSADIVYFISFAHAQRYGSDHPLAKAAAILKRELKVDLSPLLTFGDARADSPSEERALDSIWQDAAALARCARRAADALTATPDLRDLTSAFPELPDRLRELADIADWSAARGARIRLTYIL